MIGQKRPLKPKEVWAIRLRLQLEGQKRDLALFNLAIDSKLRGCDLVSLQFVALLYLLINRARRRQDILPVPLVRNSCSKHAPDIDLGYHAR
jgi:hypothetical protein